MLEAPVGHSLEHTVTTQSINTREVPWVTNRTMALRTFRFNPSLGGFGRESSSSSQKSNFLGSGSIIEQGNLTEVGNDDNEHEEEVMEADAFAQIVKELVDNAMDACRSSCPQNKNDTQKSSSRPGVTKPTKKEKKGQGKKKGNAGKSLPELDPTTQRRVIVKIVPEDIAPSLQSKTSAREGKNEKTSQAALSSGPAPRELVRVVVTDNGCGMRDIQSCVDPFYTNKAHNSSRWSSNDSASAVGNDVEKKKGKNGHLAATCNRNNTAGRYGIGLTRKYNVCKNQDSNSTLADAVSCLIFGSTFWRCLTQYVCCTPSVLFPILGHPFNRPQQRTPISHMFNVGLIRRAMPSDVGRPQTKKMGK